MSGRNGNCEPHSVPFIGTGKTRSKDVSRNVVVNQIILSFLAVSKEHKNKESLTVCIYPGNFEK
ncbi:macro domain-containing protein [Butyrivibrio fibrisolvens]|uniref:macro domain-containing protein n=1 Tax=Butyrivibrio fibrisolvens TaxID=831 RepID=UPI003B52936A